jgi:hypothetical protein
MTDKDIIAIELWKMECDLSVRIMYNLSVEELQDHLEMHKKMGGQPLW